MARPKSYSRDQVLEKAIELFARKGFEGAHLDELVRVTGLNRFSLYKEFGGKEGLFQAALDAYLTTLAELGAILQRDPPGLGNLRAFYAALLDLEFPHGCFAVNTIREKHVVPSPAFATVERFIASVEENFRRNLAAARASGELPPHTDVDTLAKFLTAFDLGLINYGLVAREPVDRTRILGVIEQLLQSGAAASSS